MGKITDMQTNQNDINLSYVRNKSKQRKVAKPRLKVENGKDILTLLGPNAHKYRLSQNQKSFQTKGRLTIAAIAAALAIGGFAVASNHIENNSAETQEFLQEDELMNNVEDKILDYVLGDNRENIDNPQVSYSFNNDDGSFTLRVTTGTGDFKDVKYTYSKGNISLDSILNAKEISSLMDNAIDVHFANGASQKQLKDLNESLEKSDNKNFILKDGHIIENKQIDRDEER